MSDQRCPQASLIEAWHDGRLGPSEEASLLRHLPSCGLCRAQQQALAAVRAALRAPIAAPTQLEHQRARIALLRAATGASALRSAPSPRWLLVVGLVVAASAAAGVATWGPALWQPSVPEEQPTRPRLPAVAEPTLASATAAPEHAGAGRARRVDAAPTPPTRQGAENGALADHQPADDEPEDPQQAPVPTVDLAPRAVDVEHPPAPARARPARRTHAASAVALAPAPPAAIALARQPAVVAPAPTLPAPTLPETPEAPVASPASRDFAGAMDALGAGDFGLAARRFAAFAAAWPADPRSDEAAYLIAIAHERAGRRDAARAAAQRYLRDRPSGAHRAQAAKMAGGGQ